MTQHAGDRASRPVVDDNAAFLAASWERSRSAGVSIDAPRPHYTADFDTSSRLARCARPVLSQLDANIADVALVIALTDSKARLIERIDVTKGMGHMVDGVEFAPGFSYSEDTMGTNGVGTVIESGRAASIVGEQHYCEKLHPFACTAAPVIEPISGRIEGTLDVTSVAGAWSPLMHTLVRTAARDIGTRLLADRSRAQQALFDTYLRADARAGGRAVFGFSDSVVMANGAAQAMFDDSEQSAIRDHAKFILSRRARAVDTIDLVSRRVVRLRCARIDDNGVKAGMIVIAESTDIPDDGGGTELDMAETHPGVSHTMFGGRPALAPVLDSRSPAWNRACKDVTRFLESSDAVLVFGEPGSGRNTLPVELMKLANPEARILGIDAEDIGSIELASVLDFVDANDTNPALLVLRDIDRVASGDVPALRSIIEAVASTKARVHLVATAIEGSVPAGVLTHFTASVVVPPLRNRTEDFELIANRVLTEIAPGRRSSISPDAKRTLSHYQWPRNVSQLREALEYALERRPVGEIQVADLPSFCRVVEGRRRLSPIEIAERDAIISALTLHEGNRVAAAKHVGISRSGIYRKIRRYGIA